jgi:hypothetical protein
VADYGGHCCNSLASGSVRMKGWKIEVITN